MNLSLTQETENPIDAQRARSRAGYERTARRFRKLGLLPQQLAERFPPIKREDWVTGAPACMSEPACGDCGSLFHGENSAACPQTFVTNIQAVKAALGIPAETKLQDFEPESVPLHPGQDNGSGEQAPAQFFLVEYFADNGVWDEVTGLRGKTAKSLIEATEAQAKLNLGTRYRIRRNDGTRAVHRIAARKVKGKNTIELYAWST